MTFLLTTLADKQRSEWMFVNEVFFLCNGYSFSIETKVIASFYLILNCFPELHAHFVYFPSGWFSNE